MESNIRIVNPEGSPIWIKKISVYTVQALPKGKPGFAHILATG